MKKKTQKTFGIKHTTIPLSPEFLMTEEGKKLLHPPQLEEVLDEIETQARKVLRDLGLDENWLVHIRKAPSDFPDEQAFHAVNILSRLARVRHWLEKQEIKAAILSTIYMMKAITDLMMTVIEPDAYRGFVLQESSSRGGSVGKFERAGNYIRWQKQATKIWKRNPSLSARAVANQIAKNSEEKMETIRRHIKKI